MTKLKKLNPLNDYVATMLSVEVPEGLEIEQAVLDSMANEGVVVGLGPDAEAKGASLGDVVVFRKNRYQCIQPESGSYKGKTINLMRMADLMITKGPSETYEVVDAAGEDE